MAAPETRAAAETILDRLVELRARCQRQTSSLVTPMGDEMFYRYQQSLIDEAATTLGTLLQRSLATRHAPQRRTEIKPLFSRFMVARLVFQRKERRMKRILLAALVLSLNLAPAFAQETCESKAVSKDGKPLAGAAKASFLKKCKRDACQIKAVGSDGRPLAGAAKRSFMQKCQREA
jgi:hypothetical protein